MNSKLPALLLTLSLASAWACTSEPDLAPKPTTKLANDAGANDGGMAGADSFTVQGGTGGTAGRSAVQSEGGGGATMTPKVDAGAGNTLTGEAGSATSAGGDTSGQGGVAGSAGEAGSAGQDSGSVVGLHCDGCSMMEVKSPAWSLAGGFMTVAPVGSPASGPDAYYAWLDALLSPNHEPMDGVYGPGLAHAPPYDNELFQLLTAAGGSAKQSFTAAEFGGLNGVALFLVAVPNAKALHGSSADFDSGPILPNDLFQFYVDGDLYRNGVLYDDAFDGPFLGYDAFSTPIDKDGPSHLVLPFGENSSYVPNVEATGSYIFRISILDTSDAGWVVDVPFTVE